MNDTAPAEAGETNERIAGLEAENARLRALIAQAGLDAIANAERQGEDASTREDELTASRASASQARADTRLARADLAASMRQVVDLEAVRDRLLVTEERLLLAFEASGSIGWWDWDIPADRLYSSPYFAQMYGIDPEIAAHGAPLDAFIRGIHAEDRDWVGEKIRHAVETAGEFAEEYRLVRPGGEIVWVHARGRCYHDAGGRPMRYPGVALDITARKKTELALVESQARLATIMEAVPVGIMVAEAPSGRIVTGNRRLANILGHETPHVESVAEYGAFVAHHEDGRIVEPQEYPLARICSGLGDRARLEAAYHRPDGRTVWIEIIGESIKDVRGRTIGGIVAVSDISERRASQERRDILHGELAHRLKNTLAVVQSVATQTLRTAPDLASARDSLTRRIQTMSQAHDILLTGQGRSGSLEAILRVTIGPHDPEGRVSLAGPDLHIGPKAGMTLALIAHELSTNASKYGSLSVPEGRVDLVWEIDEDAGAQLPILCLRWRETGGPPVVAPTRRGFGTRLIEMGLAGSVGGSVDLDYSREGLSCRIKAPLTELQSDDD